MDSVSQELLHCNVTSQAAEHIFYHHLLQKKDLVPTVKVSNDLIWPSVYLFICLALLVLVKIGSFSKVVRIVQSTFSKQVLQQLEREESNPFKFHTLVLSLLFILNVSFLIYKINTINRYVLVDKSHFIQFCFFFTLVLLVFSFKALMNRGLTLFTDQRKVILEYSISSMLINQSFGLFLFPLIVLMEFSKFNAMIFIWGAVLVLASAVLLKWYRGLLMSLVVQRIGLLQIFSYFCGLEILPVFVLVKYIIETF